jgi:hypothetical protein
MALCCSQLRIRYCNLVRCIRSGNPALLCPLIWMKHSFLKWKRFFRLRWGRQKMFVLLATIPKLKRQSWLLISLFYSLVRISLSCCSVTKKIDCVINLLYRKLNCANEISGFRNVRVLFSTFALGSAFLNRHR